MITNHIGVETLRYPKNVQNITQILIILFELSLITDPGQSTLLNVSHLSLRFVFIAG